MTNEQLMKRRRLSEMRDMQISHMASTNYTSSDSHNLMNQGAGVPYQYQRQPVQSL